MVRGLSVERACRLILQDGAVLADADDCRWRVMEVWSMVRHSDSGGTTLQQVVLLNLEEVPEEAGT